MNNKKILLLGFNGFIGSNLFKYFDSKYIIKCAGVDTDLVELDRLISESNFIIHTIGVTRSEFESDFFKININFSYQLSTILCKYDKKIFIYFSSIHSHKNDIYGFTKRYNEYLFCKEELINKNQSFIIRTPGIFGPGAKPNNVSVISTFCYNNINNIESIINEPEKVLEILFIDDLIKLVENLFENKNKIEIIYPETVKISVINLYNVIKAIGNNTITDLKETYCKSFLNNISKTYNYINNATK